MWVVPSSYYQKIRRFTVIYPTGRETAHPINIQVRRQTGQVALDFGREHYQLVLTSSKCRTRKGQVCDFEIEIFLNLICSLDQFGQETNLRVNIDDSYCKFSTS